MVVCLSQSEQRLVGILMLDATSNTDRLYSGMTFSMEDCILALLKLWNLTDATCTTAQELLSARDPNARIQALESAIWQGHGSSESKAAAVGALTNAAVRSDTVITISLDAQVQLPFNPFKQTLPAGCTAATHEMALQTWWIVTCLHNGHRKLVAEAGSAELALQWLHYHIRAHSPQLYHPCTRLWALRAFATLLSCPNQLAAQGALAKLDPPTLMLMAIWSDGLGAPDGAVCEAAKGIIQWLRQHHPRLLPDCPPDSPDSSASSTMHWQES